MFFIPRSNQETSHFFSFCFNNENHSSFLSVLSYIRAPNKMILNFIFKTPLSNLHLKRYFEYGNELFGCCKKSVLWFFCDLKLVQNIIYYECIFNA